MHNRSEAEIIEIHRDYVRNCLAEIAAKGCAAKAINTGPITGPCNAVARLIGQTRSTHDAPIMPVEACTWPALCACTYRAARG